MKATVKFIGICLLFMLIFNVNGRAMEVSGVSTTACQFVKGTEECHTLGQEKAFDANIWHSLSTSDIELGAKLANEFQNANTNNQRNRRLLEQIVLFTGLYETLLKDGLLPDGRRLFVTTPVVLFGSDYYIFALRRILI